MVLVVTLLVSLVFGGGAGALVAFLIVKNKTGGAQAPQAFAPQQGFQQPYPPQQMSPQQMPQQQPVPPQQMQQYPPSQGFQQPPFPQQ